VAGAARDVRRAEARVGFPARQRAVKAAAGLVLGAIPRGVCGWSIERLDNGTLSVMPQQLLFGTVTGIVMVVQALRPAKHRPSLLRPRARRRPGPRSLRGHAT
jgi:hypothetical protein